MENIAVYGDKTDGKQAWMVYNAASGARQTVAGLPAWFNAHALTSADDRNGNQHDEVVLGGSKTDGRDALLLYDSSSAAQTGAIPFPGWFTLDSDQPFAAD